MNGIDWAHEVTERPELSGRRIVMWRKPTPLFDRVMGRVGWRVTDDGRWSPSRLWVLVTRTPRRYATLRRTASRAWVAEGASKSNDRP